MANLIIFLWWLFIFIPIFQFYNPSNSFLCYNRLTKFYLGQHLLRLQDIREIKPTLACFLRNILMLGGTHIIANNISSVCQTVKYSWHEESDLLVIDRQKSSYPEWYRFNRFQFSLFCQEFFKLFQPLGGWNSVVFFELFREMEPVGKTAYFCGLLYGKILQE